VTGGSGRETIVKGGKLKGGVEVRDAALERDARD
jgi:hypothetical protein